MTISEAMKAWEEGQMTDSQLLYQAVSTLIIVQEAVELVQISLKDKEEHPNG